MSEAIRTGNLKKREDKGEKLWKKRFGVLYDDRIDWWKTENDFNDGKKEHGRCPINDGVCTGEADAESKRSNTFFVERTRSNGKKQRFYFKAESADDRDDWIDNINSVINGEVDEAEAEDEEEEEAEEEEYESDEYDEDEEEYDDEEEYSEEEYSDEEYSDEE